MKKIILFCAVLMLSMAFTSQSFASKLTHAIGTTDYMIREAMHAGANKKDRFHYQMALKTQKQAKKALRGKGEDKRNLDLAFDLTKQAYDYAKIARDTSDPAIYRNSKNLFEKSLQ